MWIRGSRVIWYTCCWSGPAWEPYSYNSSFITAWRTLQISNTWVAIIWMWRNAEIAPAIHCIRVTHNDRIFSWLPLLCVVATDAFSQATLSARESAFQLRFFLTDKENDWQSCNYMYTVEHHTLEFPATRTPLCEFYPTVTTVQLSEGWMPGVRGVQELPLLAQPSPR